MKGPVFLAISKRNKIPLSLGSCYHNPERSKDMGDFIRYSVRIENLMNHTLMLEVT